MKPPGWWAGHSVNPVRVMIRGRNLTGAHDRVDGPGLRAGSARASASGTYLFVDITIQRRAKPGQRSIHLSAADGSTQATFEVLQPLSRQGRFQGFSSADVFYLIIPDRFANGDPSNDEPLHNRADPRFYHGGDLEGIIQKLPYLKDLGVTTLWLTPLYDKMLFTFLGLHDVPRFAKPEGLKLAFTFLLTARGIPLIYYGDEIGMEGGGDPDNRSDFPGGWPDDTRNAFEAFARTASEQSIWERVRKLTTLRRESEALQRGRMVHLAVTEQFFAYARLAGNETVVIAINNGAEPVESELGLSATTSIGNELGGQPLREKGRVLLGPRSAGIYRIK